MSNTIISYLRKKLISNLSYKEDINGYEKQYQFSG